MTILIYMNVLLASVALGYELTDNDYFHLFKSHAFRSLAPKKNLMSIFRRSSQVVTKGYDQFVEPLTAEHQINVLISTIQILCHKFLISSLVDGSNKYKDINEKIIITIIDAMNVKIALVRNEKCLQTPKPYTRKRSIRLAKKYKRQFKPIINKVVRQNMKKNSKDNYPFNIQNTNTTKGLPAINNNIETLMMSFAPDAHRFCLKYDVYGGEIDTSINILTTTNFNFFEDYAAVMSGNNNDGKVNFDFANMMLKRLILIIMCVLNVTNAY